MVAQMINWQRVEELRDDIGAEDFEDVVDLFIEEVNEVVARLAAAQDAKQLGADLHFLKGGALNLGFDALGRLFSDGERQALAGQADSVDIPALVQAYDLSISEFKALLARGQAA